MEGTGIRHALTRALRTEQPPRSSVARTARGGNPERRVGGRFRPRGVTLFASGSVLTGVLTIAALAPADSVSIGAVLFAALFAAVVAPASLRRAIEPARAQRGDPTSDGDLDTLAPRFRELDARVEHLAAERAALLEQRLLVAYEQRRAAAHGRLTDGLVRELRAPIGVAHSSAEMALRALTARSALGEQGRAMARCMELCEAATGRAVALLRSLEEIAQPVGGECGACDPLSVIRRSVDLLSPGMEAAGISVHQDLAPVPSLSIQASLLHRTVTHLLANAIDAMPDGGRIDLALSGTIDGGVALTVQDTGPGVPAELCHRIFEPFFTTNDSALAAGLGLSISRAVVEEHGGQIELDGSFRDGARFVVEFANRVSGTTS